MKIIVFGATGGTGQFVVQQALEEGFEVTAFVRTPSKLKIAHGNLTTIKGNAFNQGEVTAAIKGHDAVVSCLGSSQGMKKSTELQEMTKIIVTGMEKNGVKRIVYIASAGIHNELPGISGKLIMRVLKNTLIDHRVATECIKANGLVYTIVRPMGLTDRPFSGKYRESTTGLPKGSRSIPRADVADFILKALKDKKYENTSIGVST